MQNNSKVSGKSVNRVKIIDTEEPSIITMRDWTIKSRNDASQLHCKYAYFEMEKVKISFV